MNERTYLDAVLIARDVMFWRGVAARCTHDPQLQRRAWRHARVAESKLVVLAVALEARLGEGVRRGTPPVPKISSRATISPP